MDLRSIPAITFADRPSSDPAFPNAQAVVTMKCTCCGKETDIGSGRDGETTCPEDGSLMVISKIAVTQNGYQQC